MKPLLEKAAVGMVGVVAACYLLNIGMGIIEIIPDKAGS
ncbi:hypothetical protein BH23VER1_BH23VER1_09240 [soil metagenome]